MKSRRAAVFVLIGFLVPAAIVGCLTPVTMDYFPDPGLHAAGWKCPDPDQMPHVIAYANPPCSWIPFGTLFKSCVDEVEARREIARGCVVEPSPTPTSTPTPSQDTSSPKPE